MTLRTALDQGIQLLREGGIDVPRLTAEVLLSHACHCTRIQLFTHSDRTLTELEWIHYGRYLHQRLNGVPTQYITKRQEFYGRDFRVTPAVLIPRPETEHLVAAALDRLTPGARVADIGTGSGCIAVSIALEAPGSRVVATDIAPDALAVAAGNAANLSGPVQFVQSDLTTALAPHSLDLLVSNPPYIDPAETLAREVQDHEPHLALFAPESGNAVYRRLTEDAPRVLRPGGHLCLELGHQSLDAVRGMLDEPVWGRIEVIADLAGIPRVLCAMLG